MLEHLPKVNISLGAIVVICFFLPWLSIDCGNIPIVKLSGYELMTGKISLDDNLLRQASEQYGKNEEDYSAYENQRESRPQFYLLMVVMCALVIAGYSGRMLTEFNKVGTVAVIAFSLFGLLLMIITSIRNFGMDIPPDAAMLVQTSHQFGFYLTAISFLGSAVLSFLGLRANAESSEELVEIQITMPPASPAIGEIEELTLEEPRPELAVSDFSDFEKSKPQEPVKKAIPPGAKTCSSCGAIVSVYQTKCMKCGSKLKAGK